MGLLCCLIEAIVTLHLIKMEAFRSLLSYIPAQRAIVFPIGIFSQYFDKKTVWSTRSETICRLRHSLLASICDMYYNSPNIIPPGKIDESEPNHKKNQQAGNSCLLISAILRHLTSTQSALTSACIGSFACSGSRCFR